MQWFFSTVGDSLLTFLLVVVERDNPLAAWITFGLHMSRLIIIDNQISGNVGISPYVHLRPLVRDKQ